MFILAGQSNMQGHAHVRTFDVMALDPATAPLLASMRNADESPRVCEQVWISSIGSSDREQTGRLTARGWLDYAVARVPQILGTTSNLRTITLEVDPAVEGPPLQTPRVFHRREGGGEWVVSGATP